MIANRDLSCAVALLRIYYVLFSYYSLCTVSLLGDGLGAGGGAARGSRAARGRRIVPETRSYMGRELN